MPTYRAAPEMMCFAPAKSFSRPENARRFARETADGLGVGYQVWEVSGGSPRSDWAA